MIGRRLLLWRFKSVTVPFQSFSLTELHVTVRLIHRDHAIDPHVVKGHAAVELPLTESQSREIVGELLGSHEERVHGGPVILQRTEVPIAEDRTADSRPTRALQPPSLESQPVYGVGLELERLRQPGVVRLPIARDGDRTWAVRTWGYQLSGRSGECPGRRRGSAFFKRTVRHHDLRTDGSHVNAEQNCQHNGTSSVKHECSHSYSFPDRHFLRFFVGQATVLRRR